MHYFGNFFSIFFYLFAIAPLLMLRGEPLTMWVTHICRLWPSSPAPTINNTCLRNLGSGQLTKPLVCSMETSANFKVFLFVYFYFICYVIFWYFQGGQLRIRGHSPSRSLFQLISLEGRYLVLSHNKWCSAISIVILGVFCSNFSPWCPS